MRILLSEKQFNLIILSETFKIKGSEWDYSPDEVIKAIKDAGYKGKSEVANKKKSLWVLANNFKIWDKIFPKNYGTLFRKGKRYEGTDLADYTPEQIRDEIKWYIDNVNNYKREDVYKNRPLLQRMDELDVRYIIDEFFPNRNQPIGKIFKKSYNQYTPDEIKMEVKQDIGEGLYKTRTQLSRTKSKLYKRILELDRELKIGLILELFPDPIESVGEYLIKLYLKSEKIGYFKEHKFDGLKSDKGGDLKVDFYLPKYGVVIEFDGRQHFGPVKWSKNTTDEEMRLEFQIVQGRDKVKNEYCNGKYILYRIKHNSRDTISIKDLNEKMGVILKDIMSGQFKLDFNKTGIYI
jgi:hypothetical protein